MPNVPPLDTSDLPRFAERFAHYENTRGFLPNSILTMARRPAIAEAFMVLNQAVLYQGSVPEETKTLVSLIASQAAGCQYCEAHMANLSSIYQASDDKILHVWEYEASPLFSDAERAALRLAHHAGLVPNQTTEEDFVELRKHYSDDEIVEIVGAISLFGYLNRWNDTMATELEGPALAVAQRTIGPRGWEPGKHLEHDSETGEKVGE